MNKTEDWGKEMKKPEKKKNDLFGSTSDKRCVDVWNKCYDELTAYYEEKLAEKDRMIQGMSIMIDSLTKSDAAKTKGLLEQIDFIDKVRTK